MEPVATDSFNTRDSGGSIRWQCLRGLYRTIIRVLQEGRTLLEECIQHYRRSCHWLVDGHHTWKARLAAGRYSNTVDICTVCREGRAKYTRRQWLDLFEILRERICQTYHQRPRRSSPFRPKINSRQTRNVLTAKEYLAGLHLRACCMASCIYHRTLLN
jgi:hypothetical protein